MVENLPENNTQILFRSSGGDDEYEIREAEKAGFTVVFRRSYLKSGLCVARYSCLPYYKELEDDLLHNNCYLINSYNQHRYIANFEYYYDVIDYTAKTYFALDQIDQPIKKDTKFVLKGRTDSRKQKWSTQMLAQGWDNVVRIYSELCQDSLIGSQGIIIREYLPFKQLGQSDITGQPYINEFRFWCLGNKILHYGYYWSIAPDEVIATAKIGSEGIEFAQKIAEIVSLKTNFFVLDIAEKEDGKWALIEINDGQMSGLPFDEDVVMYEKLFAELLTFKPI